jgi:hypothetical protein
MHGGGELTGRVSRLLMKNEEYIWTVTENFYASSEAYLDVTMQLIEGYLKMQLIKNIWRFQCNW